MGKGRRQAGSGFARGYGELRGAGFRDRTEAGRQLAAALAAHKPTPSAKPFHPYFQRPSPCTMLIDEVEAIWQPIAEADDWSAFNAKLAAIAEMRDAYGASEA